MTIPRRKGRSPVPTVTHKPVKLKSLAAITAAKWAWERRATRLTPPIMLITFFAGTPTAMWVARWWTMLVVGAGTTMLIWITQRQIEDKSVDDDISEKLASQWAARTSIVPIASTVYLETIWALNNYGPVTRLPLFGGVRLFPLWPFGAFLVTATLYFVGCVALWSFLFVSGHVTGKRLAEQVKRTWFFRTAGTKLEGSRIIRRIRTPHGERIEIDASNVEGLPSQVMTEAAREDIAVKHRIPIERVQVKKTPGAGAHRLVVEINHSNPWAKPFDHPLHPTYTLDTPGDRSICDPVMLGIDPTEQTDSRRLITKTLYDPEEGGQHILVIAGTGGGKTTLVNSIVEHVTDCRDAVVVMMDVTKAMHAAAWRWACPRVHLGEDAAEAVVVELEQAVRLIQARAASRRVAVGARKTATHQPTPEDPVLVLVLDEADQVLVEARRDLKTRAQAAIKYILSKGRSEGVIAIVMAQRGTLDYLGRGDVKANSYTRIILGMSQPSEMLWALPDWQARGVPDMSKHGEGRKGVFALVEPQFWRAGRAFALFNTELLEAVAMDRVRPEHLPALVRHLHALVDAGERIPVLAGGRWATTLRTHGLPPLPETVSAVAEPLDRIDVAQVRDDMRAAVTDPAVRAAWEMVLDAEQASQDAPRATVPDQSLLREPSDVDAAVDAMLRQTDRTTALTRHLADEAAKRGGVPLDALIAAKGGVPLPAVPAEVRAYVRALAQRAGAVGFSRAELETGLPQIVDVVPSTRWVQGVLRALVNDGELAEVGRGRAQRYRLPSRRAAA